MLAVSLLYIFGAVVDAMVEAHSKYPLEKIYVNLYQLFYLALMMVVLIPAIVYYASKLSIKIGPKKPLLLLLFMLPFASALWDMTYGLIVYKNPFWLGIEIKDWFTMPIPGGELNISIPIWFSTTWIIIRLVIGLLLLWVYFEKILPNKKFIINLE